jgi:hypothetical protein
MMSVDKEVTIAATSTDSWEDAAQAAVDRTEATVHSLQWAIVEDQWLDLKEGGSPVFKTKVNIGFRVEE